MKIIKSDMKISKVTFMLNFHIVDQFLRYLVRHPAVSFTQQADKIGSASTNLFQADRQNLTLGFLLLGYPPAQVYLSPSHMPGFAELSQLREDPLDQFLPLLVHVPEGG